MTVKEKMIPRDLSREKKIVYIKMEGHGNKRSRIVLENIERGAILRIR